MCGFYLFVCLFICYMSIGNFADSNVKKKKKKKVDKCESKFLKPCSIVFRHMPMTTEETATNRQLFKGSRSKLTGTMWGAWSISHGPTPIGGQTLYMVKLIALWYTCIVICCCWIHHVFPHDMYVFLYIYTFQIVINSCNTCMFLFCIIQYIFVFPSQVHVSEFWIIYILLNKLGNNARDLMLRVLF